jgi:hypothetical protein
LKVETDRKLFHKNDRSEDSLDRLPSPTKSDGFQKEL